ncbi:MAG: CBS domain-containing protein [Candidatus Sericytochromatia bacterium]|nr:CBS domain-containing protein [Candidatus Sericytochromatia bacterium]
MTEAELPPQLAPESVIITHIHSDADAWGALVGARHLYPEAVPVLQTSLDATVKRLAVLHKDLLGLRQAEELDLRQVRRVVVVDTRSVARLGPLYPLLDRPGVEWIVYDHHPPAKDEIPGDAGIRTLRGSATSLIVEALQQLPTCRLSPSEATLMALGIYADTGSLLYPATTPADVRAAAWLIERGADLALVSQWLEDGLTADQRGLLEQLLPEARPISLNGRALLLVGARVPEFVAGLSVVADKLQGLLEVDAVLLAVEMGDARTQMVARGRLEGVDLRGLFAPWGPAGHPQAASAHARGIPFGDVLAHARATLEASLPAELRACDLMSSPVRTIDAQAPIDAAVRLLDELGHSGLVVTRAGRPAGVISRRDLERASRHGLRGDEVRHVMTSRLETVPEDATLQHLQDLMVRRDIGRLPVMRGEAMVGIVTRSDILRAQYDQAPDRRHAVAHLTTEMSQRMVAHWPADWLAVIERVGEVAADRPVYLVGGAVRDLVLGRANMDIDVVVESDGIAFAHQIAQAFEGAQVHAHPPFGTAHVTLADGKRLDVATARTEHYTCPGALPQVAFSSLKQDLSRRDFSINCLALRIDRGHRGQLIDFFDALGDMARRELRVLHNLSFLEDPTRVLRAVRFELTLGFRLETASEAFARFALGTGTFDGTAGERACTELARLLTLPDPVPGLNRLDELGALRFISPQLSWTPAVRKRLWQAGRLAQRMGLEDTPERWLAHLALLLADLSVHEASAVSERLRLAGKQVSQLTRAWELVRYGFPASTSTVQIQRELDGLPPWLLVALFLGTRLPALRRSVLCYWTSWRQIRLSVSGHDLKRLGVPPGPCYALYLDRLLEARLAGTVSPSQELAFLADLHAREGNKVPEA